MKEEIQLLLKLSIERCINFFSAIGSQMSEMKKIDMMNANFSFSLVFANK